MIMWKTKEYLDKIIIFVIFLISSIFVVWKAGELPGLYLDAVNPDYLAVHVLNPSTFSSSWALPNLGIPFLGQAYHGTLTMFASILSILLTGTTSILQLRIVNCIYGTIACYLVYETFMRLKVKKWIAFGISLALLMSPNLTSMYKTQYYIELPGVVFMLLATLSFLKWHENIKNNNMLLYVGIFSGLAFYDYFNFLFFLPGIIVTCLLVLYKKQSKRIFSKIIILMCGYGMGGYLYILGFLTICLTNVSCISNNIKIVICIAFTIVYYSFMLYLYKLQENPEKQVIIKSSFIILGLIGTIGIISIKTVYLMNSYFIGLNVAGNESSLLERIGFILKYLFQVLCNSSEEYLVLNKDVCVGLSSIVWLTLLLAGLTVYFLMRKKIIFESKTRFCAHLTIVTFIYIVICLAMANRMQGQHFVCMLFILYLYMGILLDIIFDYFVNNNSKQKIVVNVLAAITVCSLIVLGVFNQTKINYTLQNDEEIINTYYSDVIRMVSENALENAKQGEKEYYIFPEWGYLSGFAYLTGNTIAYVDHFSVDGIRNLYNQGYSLVVCYWDEGMTSKYKENICNILNENINIYESTVICWGTDSKVLTVNPSIN